MEEIVVKVAHLRKEYRSKLNKLGLTDDCILAKVIVRGD